MRVPISWLNEFVTVNIPLPELAERLTRAGLEVSAIEYIGIPGADLVWEPEMILVANVLEVRQHPNADRLVVADVDYGAEQPHTVVTGAPNLFPFKGQGRLPHPLKAVFAREGAELYDGHADGRVKMILKGRPVRGVMSNAMLCSEKELGLSDEHEGILLLPDDAPVGMPLREYLGDAVIEIDVLPNMARCLSILGVAREVAALLGQELRMPDMPLAAHGAAVADRARVTIETPDLCPRFTVTLIEGVRVQPSPLWMQRRLTMAGMRPISNVVDISNYVMLELGQPNHMFDADRVQDQHLLIRRPHSGERLTTLDGKEHQLAPDQLLVCDPSGPLSLAGVMGGATSEVSDTTTRVLVEAAVWEPTIIRRMSTALRARSEASKRFERGVDYDVAPLTQRRLLSLLQQYAGGTPAEGMVDAYPRPWQTIVLDLTPREVRRILGLDLVPAEIAGLLRPLGFGCELTDAAVRVTVPSFRRDVSLLADLCEEVARMYGYDRIPLTNMADELPEQRANLPQERENKIRDVLVGAGLDEVITYSLTSMESVAKINPVDADAAQYLRLANPLTSEREYLRRSLLPTLLEALVSNVAERDKTALFEIGHVYLRQPEQLLPDEPLQLGIVLAGVRHALAWHTPTSDVCDFFDLKGIVETILERLNIAAKVRFVPLTDDPRLHPGRSARLVAANDDTQLFGVLGELHPQVRERMGLSLPRVPVAELNLGELLLLAESPRYRSISRFPAISQDLAVIVDQHLAAARVDATIRKYAGPQLESVLLFDVYTGPQIGAGKRSLAYRLTFRAPDRTLSDNDIAKVRAKIIRGLEFDLKATIRG